MCAALGWKYRWVLATISLKNRQADDQRRQPTKAKEQDTTRRKAAAATAAAAARQAPSQTPDNLFALWIIFTSKYLVFTWYILQIQHSWGTREPPRPGCYFYGEYDVAGF